MKGFFAITKSNATRYFVIVAMVAAMLAIPLLSSAHSVPTTSITVVNNSSREMRHLYLSSATQDNWGSDQLNGTVIGSGGGSYTLSNVSCDQSSIKVIAEDNDGCFLYQVVSCGQGSTWTISNSDTRDCGN